MLENQMEGTEHYKTAKRLIGSKPTEFSANSYGFIIFVVLIGSGTKNSRPLVR